MILVSRNIRYSRDIREGSLILGEGRQTTVGCIEERNFHCLLLAICTETIDMIYRIYNAVYSPSTAFQCVAGYNKH